MRPVSGNRHSRRTCSCADRNGLSLLEVLISVAVFMGAMTAIMFALNVGQRAEVSARLQSEAVLRCESVMGEIVAGAAEAVSSEQNPFIDDETGTWYWSSEVTTGGAVGLLQVSVTVEHRPEVDGEPNAAFRLIRYMRDPQLFLDAAIEEGGQ
jgi:general secretion pathway protein I